MSMHFEYSERRNEIVAARNAGIVAAQKEKQYGDKTTPNFGDDKELLKAWQEGWESIMNQQDHNINPDADEAGRIEE